jgi:hypothetical protein
MKQGVQKWFDRHTLVSQVDSSVKRGEATASLGSEDIFDRIINLKFKREDGASFTLRSDYEVAVSKTGAAYFKRCVQKPQIKVTYKQVANAIAIDAAIEVTNLFIDTEDIYAADRNPVTGITVQMGCINQFPNWPKEAENMLPGDEKGLLDRFYDLNNHGLPSAAERKRFGLEIDVQVLDQQITGYPPDQTAVFHGIVGTLEEGLVWEHDPADLDGFGSVNFPDGLSQIEKVLFVYLRSRFLRHDAEYRIETDEQNRTRRLFVKNYEAYKAGDEGGPGDFGTAEYTEVPLREGLMLPDDAMALGVRFSCNGELRAMPLQQIYTFGLTPEQQKELSQTEQLLYVQQMATAGSQIIEIQKAYPALRWYVLPDGSFFFYSARQNIESLFSDDEVLKRQEDGIIHLPAAYKLALVNGTRTIECPFFTWLSAFDTVAFQQNYVISDLVGFFYRPKPGYSYFLVLQNEVEFSTTGDENKCTLTCVDIDGPATPKTGDDGTSAPGAKEGETVLDKEDERLRFWKTELVSIVTYATSDPNTAPSNWLALTDRVQKSARKDMWPEGHPTQLEAFEALKTWKDDASGRDNAALFTKTRMREDSPENAAIAKALGVAGLRVPILYGPQYHPFGDPDAVVVKTPFAPEDRYTDGAKLTEGTKAV